MDDPNKHDDDFGHQDHPDLFPPVAAVQLPEHFPDTPMAIQRLRDGLDKQTLSQDDDEDTQDLSSDYMQEIPYRGRSFFLFKTTNPLRSGLRRVVRHWTFEWFTSFFIFLSVLSLILYSPTDTTSSLNDNLNIIDNICQSAFTLELILNWIVYGPYNHFTFSAWNRLDVIVTLGSWIAMYATSHFSVSAIRAVKAVRPLRAARRLGGVKAILDSLVVSVPLLVDLLRFVLFFFFCFGIMGMSFYRGSLSRRCIVAETGDVSEPISYCKIGGSIYQGQYQCPSNQVCEIVGNPSSGFIGFDNIGLAFLTIMRIVSLDQWSEILYALMESEVSFLSVAFFVGIIIIVTFICLNLFVAVINTVFGKIRKTSGNKSGFSVQAKSELRLFDATITKATNVYNLQVAKLRLMTMSRGIEPPVWWGPFQERMAKLIKDRRFEYFMMLCILINFGFISSEHDGQSDRWSATIRATDIVFTVVYVLECIVKIIGHGGFVPYVRDPDVGRYNRFDFAISFITLVTTFSDADINISFFRSLRVLRIFRLFRKLSGLVRILESALSGVAPILNLLTLVVFSLLIFSIVGVQLYGGKMPDESDLDTRQSFETFPNAMLSLFTAMTGDHWTMTMQSALLTVPSSAWTAPIFFVGFFVFSNYVLLNLFTALILENFEVKEEEKLRKQKQLYEQSKRHGASMIRSGAFGSGRFGRIMDTVEGMKKKVDGVLGTTSPTNNGGNGNLMSSAGSTGDMSRTSSWGNISVEESITSDQEESEKQEKPAADQKKSWEAFGLAALIKKKFVDAGMAVGSVANITAQPPSLTNSSEGPVARTWNSDNAYTGSHAHADYLADGGMPERPIGFPSSPVGFPSSPTNQQVYQGDGWQTVTLEGDPVAFQPPHGEGVAQVDPEAEHRKPKHRRRKRRSRRHAETAQGEEGMVELSSIHVHDAPDQPEHHTQFPTLPYDHQQLVQQQQQQPPQQGGGGGGGDEVFIDEDGAAMSHQQHQQEGAPSLLTSLGPALATDQTVGFPAHAPLLVHRNQLPPLPPVPPKSGYLSDHWHSPPTEGSTGGTSTEHEHEHAPLVGGGAQQGTLSADFGVRSMTSTPVSSFGITPKSSMHSLTSQQQRPTTGSQLSRSNTLASPHHAKKFALISIIQKHSEAVLRHQEDALAAGEQSVDDFAEFIESLHSLKQRGSRSSMRIQKRRYGLESDAIPMEPWLLDNGETLESLRELEKKQAGLWGTESILDPDFPYPFRIDTEVAMTVAIHRMAVCVANDVFEKYPIPDPWWEEPLQELKDWWQEFTAKTKTWFIMKATKLTRSSSDVGSSGASGEMGRKKKSQSVIHDGSTVFCMGTHHWLRSRIRAAVRSRWTERLFLIAVFASSVMLAFERPREATDPTDSNISGLRLLLQQAEIFFMIFFTLECVLKVLANGVYHYKTSYFRDPWNKIDFVILITMYLAYLVPSVRFVRVLRAIRPIRIVKSIPQLQVIVLALWASVPAILNVTLVTLFSFVVFGILGVNLFKGMFYSCTDDTVSLRAECVGVFLNSDNILTPRTWKNAPFTFDNLGSAVLTLMIVASRSNWSDVMYNAMDVVGKDLQPIQNNTPANALFFVAFIIVGSFFIMNLFVGVIIENINQARGISFLTDEQKQWSDTQRAVLQLRPSPEIHRPSSRHRGRLYDFVTHRWFEHVVLVCIVLNIGAMAAEYSGQSTVYAVSMETIEKALLIVFTAEAVFKLIAFGPSNYFSDNWRRFDFALVVGSICSLILEFASNEVGVVLLSRVFRILRIFRIVNQVSGLSFLFDALIVSLPSILNISLLMFLLLYIYTVAGMQLFGHVRFGDAINRRVNFRTFANGLLLLFRVTTLDSWDTIMLEYGIQKPYCTETTTFADCGSRWAWLYFVTFFTLGSYVFLNLVIAIILDNFGHCYNKENFKLKPEHFKQFQLLWKKYDPKGSGFIGVWQVKYLVQDLWEYNNPMGFDMYSDDQRLVYPAIYLEIESVMQKKRRRIAFHKLLLILARHCVNPTSLTYAEEQERKKLVAVAAEYILVNKLAAVMKGFIVRKVFVKKMDPRKIALLYKVRNTLRRLNEEGKMESIIAWAQTEKIKMETAREQMRIALRKQKGRIYSVYRSPAEAIASM